MDIQIGGNSKGAGKRLLLFFIAWIAVLAAVYNLTGQSFPYGELSGALWLFPGLLVLLALTSFLYWFSLSSIGIRLSMKELAGLYLVVTTLDFLSGQMLPVGEAAGVAYISKKRDNADKTALWAWAGALVLSSWAGFGIAAGLAVLLAVCGVGVSAIYSILCVAMAFALGEKIFGFVPSAIRLFGRGAEHFCNENLARIFGKMVLVQALLFIFTGFLFGAWAGQAVDVGTVSRNAAGYYVSFIASTGVGVIPGVFESINLLQAHIGIIKSASIVVYAGIFQLVFFWLPLAAGIPYVLSGASPKSVI